MPYLVAPDADFSAGLLITTANALIRPTEDLTGLTNGTAYRAVRLSDASDPFTPAAANVYTDDFNRADGPLAGGIWTSLFGLAGAFTISSNAMLSVDATESGIAVPAVTGADTGAYVEGDMLAILDAGGIAFMQDSNNYVCAYARLTDSRTAVRGRIAGTIFGPTAGASTSVCAPGDRLRFELVNGQDWTIKRNGTSVQTGSLSAPLTGIRGGFAVRLNTGANWDNFAHGPL